MPPSSRARRAATAGATALLVGAGALALLAPSATAAPPSGQERGGKTNSGAVEPDRTYDRFLVHFSPGAAAAREDAAARGEVEQVERGSGRGLEVDRRMATGGVVVQVDEALDAEEAQRLIERFAQRPSVSFVEPDVQVRIALSPNDPSYGAQWHYSEATAGMNLPTAWDTADGSGVTVAVIDTGITQHSDLDANVVAGYDFISSSAEARDGNGRDPNPADEGDWHGLFDCLGSTGGNSSWHGTHVAGTVGAVTGNANGVSGVAFGAKISPVRALGRCGGSLSDIADAITWASGGTVAGVPANPNPAKVINLSLGGSGSCGAAFANAINGAVSRGSAVVVAAGNENSDAAGTQPASCANTVVVAASDRQGNRASYSNYGAVVDLAAPGGETATQANGVLSTLNSGTRTPAGESYGYYQGTSMAAPHVTGLAALVLGEGSLSPADLESLLKAGARPLPGSCSGGCGAGLADAGQTLALLGPAPSPEPSPSTSPSPEPSPQPSPTTEPSPEPSPTTAPSLFTNDQDYPIADLATVESPITVSGRSGNAPSGLKVPVDIRHTYRGDLQIDLIAPDGTAYRLKSTATGLFGDSADDVRTTYTVDASSESASGTWTLRVRDAASGDTGYLDSWSLQF
jgi:serine protease